MKVIKQVAGISFSFYYLTFSDLTYIVKFSNKQLYLMSHLAFPPAVLLTSNYFSLFLLIHKLLNPSEVAIIHSHFSHHYFFGNNVFCLLNIFGFFVKLQMAVVMWTFVLISYFVPLVYLFNSASGACWV